MRSDEDQIRALIARYLAAYEANDAAGCAAVYSNDALVVSPWGPPDAGISAIAQAHHAWFKEGEANKVMTIKDLIIQGDLAVCLIHYTADIPTSDGRTAKVCGVSLNSLTRQADQEWKIKHTSLTELENETGFEP